jgi:altronate dehydratase
MRVCSITRAIVCHPKDNVAMVTFPTKPGMLLSFSKRKKIIAKRDIPFAHKIALRGIRKGNPVIKYGERIGVATCDIKPGEWVHIHNVVGERGRRRRKK